MLKINRVTKNTRLIFTADTITKPGGQNGEN